MQEIIITGCLHCNKPLKGRCDKKFCNDYCRNNYNNNLRKASTNLVRNINNALSKNKRILDELIPEDKEVHKVHKEKLMEKGFQFRYITHTYTNKKGSIYSFCYNLGYLELEEDWYLLVKRKESEV